MDAVAFGALAVVLSALWLAFAALILTVFQVRISGVSVYVCLLLVCGVLAAVAHAAAAPPRGGRRHACMPGGSQRTCSVSPTRSAPRRSAAPGMPSAACWPAPHCLAAAHSPTRSAPHQAPAGYTWLAWSGAKANGVIAVGAHGIALPFEITHEEPGTTEYRLTASWTGGGKAHALAAPRTLRVAGVKTVAATLSIPQPPGACAYRVVVTLTELGTARPRSWSINAGVRASLGTGGPARCAS